MIAKTPEEIAILREGGKRLARHVRIIAAMVNPGANSAELEAKAREMVARDGDEMAFFEYKTKRGKKRLSSPPPVFREERILPPPPPPGTRGGGKGGGWLLLFFFRKQKKGFFPPPGGWGPRGEIRCFPRFV